MWRDFHVQKLDDMKTILVSISLILVSCSFFTKTMYVTSLKDVDTTYVKIYHVDSTENSGGKIFVVEYRPKK